MEECVETKYDTYIEHRFFERLENCIKEKEYRERIKIAWLSDKKLYTDLADMISLEFIHYSLHNISHSVNILQNIYQLLGKEIIDTLSVGDLWLLLESAYSHDIGMSTTREELEKIWDDENSIREIVERITMNSDKKAMETYKYIKKYIDMSVNEINVDDTKIDINKTFKKEHKNWPLEIRQAVTLINCEYIRSRHPERSKELVLNLVKDDYNHLRIEERMYRLVGIINYLHGEDFSQIKKELSPKDTGFATETIHPRLIAMLLRVGDGLDVRNNRYNYWGIRYLGILPSDSQKHFEKHKGLTDFLIDEENVIIHIKSTDFTVCRISRDWLDMVENNLKDLIFNWNQFAPRCIKQIKLRNVDLVVYYKDIPFLNEDFNAKMQVDTNKLTTLLSGKNFYNTKLVVFRELIQNAIDATKIRIANMFYQDKNLLKKNQVESFKEVLPEYFSKEFYEQFKIEILVSYGEDDKGDKDKISFEIVDHGVGMDEDGLEALFHIGKGWKGREELKNKLDLFPDWLTPTGGFGIGILATFLLCNKVTFSTKSKKSPQYIITIFSPNENSKIEKLVNYDYYDDTGTKVKFEIPFIKFMNESFLYFKEQGIKSSLHNLSDATDRLNYIVDILDDMISSIFTNMPFKIMIKNKINNFEKLVNNDLLFDVSKEKTAINFWNTNLYSKNELDVDINKNMSAQKNNEQYRVLTKTIFFGYNKKSENMIIKDNFDSKCMFSYKGIVVDRNRVETRIEEKQLLELCDKYIDSIDIYNKKVDEILEISRTDFIDGFNLSLVIKNSLYQLLFELLKEEPSYLEERQLTEIGVDLLLLFANTKLINDFFEKVLSDKEKFPNYKIITDQFFKLKLPYLNYQELQKDLKIEHINNCMDLLQNISMFFEYAKIYFESNNFTDDLLKDNIKKIFINRKDEIIDAYKKLIKYDDIVLSNEYQFIERKINPILNQLSKFIKNFELTDEKSITNLKNFYENNFLKLKFDEIQQIEYKTNTESVIKILFVNKKINLLFKDSVINNDAYAKDQDLLQERNFYLKNDSEYKEYDFSKWLNVKITKKELPTEYNNQIEYYELSFVDPIVKDDIDLVQYITKNSSVLTIDKALIEINDNVNIKNYEKIVLDYNIYDFSKQRVIINPFNELNLDISSIIMYNDYEIKNLFNSFDRFNQIIELVDYLKENNSKEEIREIYFKFILNILKSLKQETT